MKRKRFVALIWDIVVSLAVTVSMFLTLIHTPWGRHAIPSALLRLHLIKPKAALVMTQLYDPRETARVDALIDAIQRNNARQWPVIMVWSGKRDDNVASRLYYRLYPQAFSERFPKGDTPEARERDNPTEDGAPPPDTSVHPDRECIIRWPTEDDLTLTCPDSVWQYSEPRTAAR